MIIEVESLVSFGQDSQGGGDVNQKMNNMYSRKLSLIFLDVKKIDNIDIFSRQLKAIINKEKIFTVKDKIVEKLENIIKGVEKNIIIGMFPYLIKLNENASEKLIKIRDCLELISKLSR